MEYSVQALARLSGVSRRTLHHYDAIGLLRPMRVEENGYRVYGPREVDLLQKILFYRACGMKLSDIRATITAPEPDDSAALSDLLTALLERQETLTAQIENLKKTIQSRKGETTMKDTEKFEGFRGRMIAENEEKFGKEARARYGEEAVDASVFKMRGMREADWEAAEALRREAEAFFTEAMTAEDAGGETAQHACERHGEWLRLFWKAGAYSKAAHLALGEMYAADERFTAYYDAQVGKGGAAFILEALRIYCADAQ